LSENKKVMSDKRGGKIALVVHCVLNQNSRASGLARRAGAMNEIVKWLMQKGIGIVQLPCPELTYAGASRPPQTKEQYDTPKYRNLCIKFAEDVAGQIQGYEKCGVRLILIVGIGRSPSCAVNEPSGILMEELRKALCERGISAPFYDIDSEGLKEDLTKLEELLRQ
jgi:predicted secreted protein